MKNKKGNRKVYDKSGFDIQSTIWIEEMSELMKPLCKIKRYGLKDEYIKEVKEELVDVEICLDQIRYALGIKQEFEDSYYNYKVDRQIKRLESKEK